MTTVVEVVIFVTLEIFDTPPVIWFTSSLDVATTVKFAVVTVDEEVIEVKFPFGSSKNVLSIVNGRMKEGTHSRSMRTGSMRR